MGTMASTGLKLIKCGYLHSKGIIRGQSTHDPVVLGCRKLYVREEQE